MNQIGWLPMRCEGTREIWHRVHEWRNRPASAFRHESICGKVDTPCTEVQGALYCLECMRLDAG